MVSFRLFGRIKLKLRFTPHDFRIGLKSLVHHQVLTPVQAFQQAVTQFTRPAKSTGNSLLLGAATDLAKSKSQLVMENAR